MFHNTTTNEYYSNIYANYHKQIITPKLRNILLTTRKQNEKRLLI